MQYSPTPALLADPLECSLGAEESAGNAARLASLRLTARPFPTTSLFRDTGTGAGRAAWDRSGSGQSTG